MYNKAILVGNQTRDIEVRHSQQNTNQPQQQYLHPTYAQPNKQQPTYDEKTMSDIGEMDEVIPF